MIGHRRQLSATSARAALRVRALIRATVGPRPVAVAPPLPVQSDPDGTPERAPEPVGPPGELARGRARLALDARAAIALVLVAVVAVAIGAAVWLRARPHEVQVGAVRVLATGTPAPGAVESAGRASPSSNPRPTAPAEVLVDVQGEVRRPGVVRLPAGSRVRDALRAAGGARPGVATASLNLARPVSDGEQLVLDPERGPAGQPAVSSGGAAATGSVGAGGPAPAVDLNSAGLAELDELPGVGPVLAQRILDWRATNGRFTAVEELQEVSGIGPATFADLRSRVRV